jgi:hypothetical protein
MRFANAGFQAVKHRMETTGLYEPLLYLYVADAVERWFDESQISSVIAFTSTLEVYEAAFERKSL